MWQPSNRDARIDAAASGVITCKFSRPATPVGERSDASNVWHGLELVVNIVGIYGTCTKRVALSNFDIASGFAGGTRNRNKSQISLISLKL